MINRCRCFFGPGLFFGAALSMALIAAPVDYARQARAADADAVQEAAPRRERPLTVPDALRSLPAVRIEDVTRESAMEKPFPFVALRHSPIMMRYENGKMSLFDSRSRETPLWAGPVAWAQFAVETVAGVHTLRDGAGQTLWSDAAETPTPDLQLLKPADGSAQLLDRNNSVLWSGRLSPSPREQRDGSARHGSTYRIRAAGVRIDGDSGEFSVTDAVNQTILWSGRLPKIATLLVRDADWFLFYPVNVLRYESGYDRVTGVSYEARMGTVRISDLQDRVIGEFPMEYLTVSVVARRTRQAKEKQEPPQEYTQSDILPKVSIKTDGAIIARFKDSKGQVLHRFLIARSGDWGRGMG